MSQVEQIRNLAAYYRDLLAAVSQQSGRHLVDLGTTLRYGLTTDLGLFIDDIETVLNKDKLLIPIERMSPQIVSDIMSRTDVEEEAESEADEIEESEIDLEKKTASSRLIAIYRKQEQDRYNRETTIGFPIVAGKYGSKKFCAPLFYITVKVDYDPLASKISLVKDFETPVFNSNLIAKLVSQDDETELVRQKVLPLLYEEDFSLDVINKTIRIIAELVQAFRGLTKDSSPHSALSDAFEARENQGAKVFNAISIVNSARSNAFLQDELIQLANLEEVDGETVIRTLLSEVPENIDEDTDDPDAELHKRPLLFPLQSNQAQRRAARKAEKARLMVVQGPPGTGKSQTIANLVCDLVAQDKSVLIASHQNKALEVIAEKLPGIEYLAMSLLKGEKESTAQLANQLSSFDSFIADAELYNLNESYEKTMQSIVKKENEIRQLKVRFSELKTLERRQHPQYYRFHEIREYNKISPEDTIPEGQETAIVKGITEWCLHFKSVCGHFDELNQLFDEKDLEKNTGVAYILTKLINLYDEAVSVKEETSQVTEFKQLIIDADTNYQETLNLLISVKDWLTKHGNQYLLHIERLSELGITVPDIDSGRKIVASFNNDLLEILGNHAEETYLEAQKLVREGLPSTVVSIVPKDSDIDTIESAVEKLFEAGRIKWTLDPGCIAAKRSLSQYGINLEYNSKDRTLKQIKEWVSHWRLKSKVIQFIKSFFQAGIPVKEITAEETLGEILTQTNLAVSYLNLLQVINQLPRTVAPQKVTQYANELMRQLSNSESLNYLRELFENLTNYINVIINIESLGTEIRRHGNQTAIEAVCRSICNLEFSGEINELVDHFRNLLKFFPEYSKLVSLENTTLSNLENTLKSLRKAIISNREPEWLQYVEKALEAYRLSQFISRDVLENPDNIDEVAAKIRRLREEKRDLVIRALRIRRKAALKYASADNAARQQITKLKKLLGRKKKTISLMQLKGKVDYERLLNVFPCWIMSIDDVARIFPLKEGLFDYLIVDEASQCNQATALHLAYRAKRMIVVGDHKQMKNPNVRFLSDKLVRMLLGKHSLEDHPKAEFLHGRESLLSLADISANCNEFLNEHFRCEPPIIAWSNKEFYDNKLRILTPIRAGRFKPSLEVRLVMGADDNPEKKQNIVEAEAVINEVIQLISSGQAEGMTIGVMSLFREQATLLHNMLYEKLEEHPEWLKQYQITASTADGFQGDERDIIFYSMRYGPSTSPGTINAIQLEPERINVAFSRARRKTVCFISRPIEEFPKGIIKEFLRHADQEQKNPSDRLGLIGEDKFDSNFERDVCFNLRNRGLIVYTQVPCASFSIDMVVIDKEGRRMAIECDGDFHYEEDGDLRPEDYQRQDIIERSGWFVHRIPARRYYNNSQAAIEMLLEDLSRQPTDEQINYSEQVKDNQNNQFSSLNEEHMSKVDISDYEENADKNVIDDREETTNQDDIGFNEVENVTRIEAQARLIGLTPEIKPRDQATLSLKSRVNKREPVWEKEVWFSLSHWGKDSGKLSGHNNAFCYKIGLCLARNYKLTEKQKEFANKLWNAAISQGFEPNVG